MRIICLFILSFIGTFSFAQNNEETTVANAVEKLRSGLLSADRAILEGITADELTYGHSSGLIQDKKAFVEDLATGKSDFTMVELTNQTIRITGDVALVRHELHADVNGNHVDLGVLLVWQKQKGSWKLVARQAYRL